MSLSVSQLCQNITPSVTLKINALAAELRTQGKDVISLGAGEPDFDTPIFIRMAAKYALEDGQTRYTAAAGTAKLRQAVAYSLKKKYGLSYTKDQILICNGAKQALLNALVAMLDPGDEVLLPTPCWVSYPEMIAMAGGKTVRIPADESEGFIPPLERIRAAVTDRTKVIILNSPNNPTGAVWSRDQLLAVGQLAVEKKFYIISDEIYDQLLYDGVQACSVPTLSEEIYNQTVLVNGWSKAYAMTGWRLGYAAGPQEVIAAMAAYQSHSTGNPNSIAQEAGVAALMGEQGCVREMARAFDRRRERALDIIKKIPRLRCFKPMGAFYILLDLRGVLGGKFRGEEIRDSLHFAELLLRHYNVAAVPGDSFGAEGYLRLSYALAEEKLVEALRRIQLFCSEIS